MLRAGSKEFLEMMNRRVVVTGLGMVSPLGADLATSWKNALEGKSGIGRITPLILLNSAARLQAR